MKPKIDLKKLRKIKGAIDILGKNIPMDYSPLKEGRRKKMIDADKMEIETELTLTPTAYEEGSNPARAAKIMKEVEKRRAYIRNVRAGK